MPAEERMPREEAVNASEIRRRDAERWLNARPRLRFPVRDTRTCFAVLAMAASIASSGWQPGSIAPPLITKVGVALTLPALVLRWMRSFGASTSPRPRRTG